VDAGLCDSCVRLTPYCSLLIVKYDISCGGQSSNHSVGYEYVLGSCALPGAVGIPKRRLGLARLRRGWTNVLD
jgi:hypothetical protein